MAQNATTLLLNYIGQFDAYKITTHGANVWTQEALANVALLRPFFDKARDAIGGEFSSVFRDARVNKVVDGDKASRHMRGLACDITPGASFATVQAAAAVIFKKALTGELGPVQKVIQEPTWVHVGWYPLLEGVPTVEYRIKRREGTKWVYPLVLSGQRV